VKAKHVGKKGIDLKLKKIAVYVFPDVEELDFVGVYEVLAKTVAMKEDGSLLIDEALKVDTIGPKRKIRCANGLIVEPHRVTDDFQGYDMVIIPGGKGVRTLTKDKAFLERIKRFSEDHVVCSVCTGSLVLAEAGVLEGRKGATHHDYRDELSGFCKVVNERVVVDGNVITTGGVSSSLDLGLEILEIVYGKRVADQVADRLEIRPS